MYLQLLNWCWTAIKMFRLCKQYQIKGDNVIYPQFGVTRSFFLKRSLDVTCIGRDDNFRTLPQGNLEQLNWIWHLHQNYVVSFFKLCIELRLNWNTKAIKKTTEILSGEDHHGCILNLSISLYIYEHWLLHDEKRKQEHFISCVLEVNFCCLCSR